MSGLVLDYSAHACWDTCPAQWFERYVNKRVPKWPRAQRDDALALGSLVHEGLRLWQERQIVEIPTSVIDEVTPTRECLSLAQELVYGYTRTYPEELWPLVKCEEPVTMPLREQYRGYRCDNCDYSNTFNELCHLCGGVKKEILSGIPLTLLAKIDSYFYVPEPTMIESGIPGIQWTLNPGWWIHEYKTKSPFISMPLYMQGWEMNMQASYQVLALSHKLRQEGADLHGRPVQGTLVNVLEKPRRHIPKRKCRSCQETYEFYTWVPTGSGEYACPVCGVRQKLTPLKQDIPTIPPAYYRLIVTRSPRELESARRQILQVGQRMIAMETGGLDSEPWNTKSCVNFQWKRACEYFGVHRNGTDSRDDDHYMEAPEYRGLVQLEGAN